MKRFMVLIVSISIFSATSCTRMEGTGPVVKETVQVSAFQGYTLEIPATVFYTPAPVFKVEIEGQKNILSLIRNEVKNGVLYTRLRNNVQVNFRDEIKLYIEAPDLKQLQIAGTGQIKVKDPLHPQNLYLGISGTGSMEIPMLQTDFLHADITGTGEIRINGGVAVEADIDIRGNGFAHWENITIDSLQCRISGSATLRVFVNDFIKTTISGAGTLLYKGNPLIESDISGTGKIIRL